MRNRKLYLESNRKYNEKHREERRLLAREWRVKNKQKKTEYNKNYAIGIRKKRLNGGIGEMYRNLFDSYPRGLYYGIKERLTRCKTYKNRKLLFSMDEFLYFVFNKSNYKNIYNIWVENNRAFKFAPSVDRIDNNGDYSLDNIQIISISENSRKGNK